MFNTRRRGIDQARKITLTAAAASHETAVKRIKSEDLFQQMSEVEIEHGDRVYRLRITQFNKLILTA
ncbi:hemin uptake protein HemP [Herbaspirillum sp. HC18]|nr:hemin uptake protein HemP [Herbaspirillum sp. HC18]